MARDRQLILNRYRPIGEAKAGGFGTVRVAWDTRIQRKVAIKCIELDEVDAARAALPGANAVAQRAPQHEPLPWEDDPVFNDADEAEGDATSVFDLVGDGPLVHSLAHVPGLDEAHRGNAVGCEHRRGVRFRGAGVHRLPHHGVRRRRHAHRAAASSRRPSHIGCGGCRVRVGVSRVGGGARQPGAAPRHQARQRADQPSRPGESHRFRPGHAGRRVRLRRGRRRNHRVHAPGADAPGEPRRALRRMGVGVADVRDAGGREPVSGTRSRAR